MKQKHSKNNIKLAILATGIVFGDIGTSPIYTIREVFSPKYGILLNINNLYGILSTIFWLLIIVVSIKYVFVMLNANNKGEGGLMALLALISRHYKKENFIKISITTLAIFGAALFYGDGFITPAISVISAIEGLTIASPLFESYTVPITIIIVTLLFSIQKKGTTLVGIFFGPITIIWFLTLGFLGILQIIDNPQILLALNPYYAINFFINHHIIGFVALGAIVLAVTGTEGIYTDMGHFGKKPIRIAWFFLVLPCLILNYFGQGALLLSNANYIDHPFYNMVPNWALYYLVVLATVATIIASQAVISGTFSLTRQAVQLGFFPRLNIIHTSDQEQGQIYIPFINWVLYICVVALIVIFESSSNLAGIYGIAITGMMTIDTILLFFVLWKVWKMKLILSVFIFIIFLALEIILFMSNNLKVLNGGWFPILVGIFVFLIFTTWKKGRAISNKFSDSKGIQLESFIKSLAKFPPVKVDGTAVYLCSNNTIVPHALLHNLNHNKVLHDKNILLSVKITNDPYVDAELRCKYNEINDSFKQISIFYGFKESMDIPKELKINQKLFGISFDNLSTSYFFSRQTIIPKFGYGMAIWREKIYTFLYRNATSVTTYFKIPINRVIELGTRIEI